MHSPHSCVGSLASRHIGSSPECYAECSRSVVTRGPHRCSHLQGLLPWAADFAMQKFFENAHHVALSGLLLRGHTPLTRVDEGQCC